MKALNSMSIMNVSLLLVQILIVTVKLQSNIESQDLFTHLSESYLIFEGHLTKADGTAYANTDLVMLTNNGIIHLFNRISYYLSSQEIETVSYPGQTTT